MQGNIPTDPQDVTIYLKLGKQLHHLQYTATIAFSDVAESVRHCMSRMDTLRFDYPKAQLEGFLTKAGKTTGQAACMTPSLVEDLRSIMTGISEQVYKEGLGRESIILFKGQGTTLLRDLEPRLPDDHQKAILENALQSLERGINPMVIVLMWNLTYHFIKWWIFNDKTNLGNFNAQLGKTKIQPNSIVSYEDFLDLNERTVIDQAYHAGLYAKQKSQILVPALDTRNQCAHSYPHQVGAIQAVAYVQNLVDNILMAAPFSSGLLPAP
jgi:hypothetical protein